MALATLTQVKTFLKIPLDYTDDDVQLQAFIDSVSSQIKNFTECSFEPVVVTREMLDGIQADIIVTKSTPIISVQKVIFGCDVQGNGGIELEPSAYYNTESVIKLRYAQSPRGRGFVRVDYTHGYSTVPADVLMALYQAVKAEMGRFNGDTEGLGSIRKQDESVNYNGGWDDKTGLPKQIVSKLQPYRSYGFPVGAGFAQRNW